MASRRSASEIENARKIFFMFILVYLLPVMIVVLRVIDAIE